MIRMGTNPIIFLLDNCEYVIEEQIHPGPYNKLQGWDYCALAHAMKGTSDNLFATKVISHIPAMRPSLKGPQCQVHLVCRRLSHGSHLGYRALAHATKTNLASCARTWHANCQEGGAHGHAGS